MKGRRGKLLILFAVVGLSLVSSRNLPNESTTEEENEELIFVHGIFRHGDRTPIRTYPTDPHANSSLWSQGAGQLTNLGKQQQFELGKYIRQRYKHFLPSNYHCDDIIMNSTDVDRTLMSAQLNLAALYEDQENNWKSDLKWQPIPVHTIPEKLDRVLAAKKYCPKFEYLRRKLKESQYFTSFNIQHDDVYKYISDNSGTVIRDADDAVDIQDALFIQELNGLELPKWSRKVYPDQLLQFVVLWLETPCFTPEMARLKIGPFFKTLINHMEDKINRVLKQKMWLYSAHDTNLSNILKSLNVFNSKIPPYCSLILFELKKRQEDYFVELYFRNSTEGEPHYLQVPGCQRSCPFEEFKRIMKPLLPEDWEEECRMIGD